MKKLRVLFIAACVLLGSTGQAFAISIVYNDFSDISDFQLNGSALGLGNPVFFGGQHVLRLTDDFWDGGSAFLKSPVSLAADASFSTAFQFQITDNRGIGSPAGADGLVFTVQTVSNDVGGAGVGIGYSGIPNSVGVEFDTFNNGSIDGNNGNHIGINTNGNINSVARANYPDIFNDGSIFHAWIDYNGVTDLLEVRAASSAVRPVTPFLSHTVDLVSVLGQTDAYIGFTSGTGAGTGDHDIRAWQLNTDYDPINRIGGNPGGTTVPEPSTVLLMGLGLAAAGVVKKVRS